jgi:hypothetical protein
MLRWSFIALFAAFAVGCVAQTERQELIDPRLPSVLEARVRTWHACLDSSFANHSRSMGDPNLAAEVAFQSCQSEEAAFFSAGGGGMNEGTLRLAVEFKAKKKAELLRRGRT